MKGKKPISLQEKSDNWNIKIIEIKSLRGEPNSVWSEDDQRLDRRYKNKWDCQGLVLMELRLASWFGLVYAIVLETFSVRAINPEMRDNKICTGASSIIPHKNISLIRRNQQKQRNRKKQTTMRNNRYYSILLHFYQRAINRYAKRIYF